MRRRQGGSFLGVLLVLVDVGTSARSRAETTAAPEEGRFALEMRDCPRVSEEAVRRMLRIEIGDLLRPPSEAVGQDGALLTIRCARSVAWVEAVGPGAAAPLAQRLFLDEIPDDAAPRALALAGLELLAATNGGVRARLAENRPEASPAKEAEARAPEAARPPPEEARASLAPPREAERATSVELAGAWRSFRAPQGLSAWGARAGVDLPLRAHGTISADGDFVRTERSFDELGRVGAWLISCGATFGGEARRGPLAGSVGLGWRVGLVRWSAETPAPEVVRSAPVWRAWGGPLVALKGRLLLGRFGLMAGAEAGRAILEAEGQAFGAAALAARGFWLGLWLGGDVGI